MAIYSLAATRDELKKQLGSRTDIDNARYNRWINDAVLVIADELELENLLSSYLISTKAGQELYNLTSGTQNVQSVALADDSDSYYGGYPLEMKDLKWYRQQAAITGKPTHWFRFNNILVLWPKPDGVYNLVVETDLVGTELLLDTDLLPFGSGVNSLVVLRARWIANDALGQPEAAALAQNSYITQMRMRVDHAARQQIGRNLRVSVPTTERQLRLGDRGYRDDAILKSS